MTEKDYEYGNIIPNYLGLKYDLLLKALGREGKLSLELKCLLLVFILYIPGLVTTIVAGTWRIYVFDEWRRFIVCIFIAVFMWFMVRFLKRLKEKIQRVSQIISPPRIEEKGRTGYKEWNNWKQKLDNYREWMNRSPHLWSLLSAVLGIIGGIIVSICFLDPTKVKWIQGNPFNEIYFRSWFIGLGLLTGASLFGIFTGFWTLRKYCNDVVSQEEILPLAPDRTGGLKELGRLSLDLDLIVALPSIVFPLYLIGRDPEYLAQIGGSDLWRALSVLYALVLILVFFVSISPAHDDMAKAKDEYLLKIHSEYRDIHEKVLRKLEPDELMGPEEYKRLSGLYELYDRVNSMAVWPLDFQTTIRFAITSILPILSIGISFPITL